MLWGGSKPVHAHCPEARPHGHARVSHACGTCVPCVRVHSSRAAAVSSHLSRSWNCRKSASRASCSCHGKGYSDVRSPWSPAMPFRAGKRGFTMTTRARLRAHARPVRWSQPSNTRTRNCIQCAHIVRQKTKRMSMPNLCENERDRSRCSYVCIPTQRWGG